MANTDTTSDSSSTQGRFPSREFPPKWSHLVSEYLRDLPGQIKSIRATLQIKDYAKIKKQAHRIKGTSGTYGLQTISKNAAQLEQSAETKDPDRIIIAINNITTAIAIETIRQNSKSPSPTAKPKSQPITEIPNRERPARKSTGRERTANA